ncbi:hypothetical protein ACW9KT_05205 [Hymenobacter sp. HD11105]
MNEISRNIALGIEIGNSIKFLRSGLSEIQKIYPGNDFYDPILLFLSSGLERLFKSMICLNFKELNGRLPNYNELIGKNNGHDIESLKKRVELFCIPVNRPFAAMDYDIITKDVFANDACKILSAYARKARYFNLDAVLGIEQELDAKNEWQGLESSLLIEYYGFDNYWSMILDGKQIDQLYKKSNELIVSRFELFFRAICRQFLFGNFSSESKRFLFEIETFQHINDEDIGKTAYYKFRIGERIKK